MVNMDEMFYGTLPQDTQDFSQVLRGVGRSIGDIGRGVSYYPYDLLGAPVDIINMALQPVGLGSERPVLGSDYLRNIAQSLGYAQPSTGSGAETAGRLGAAFVNPAAGARAVGQLTDLPAQQASKAVEALMKTINREPQVNAQNFRVKESGGTLELTPTGTSEFVQPTFGETPAEGIFPGTVISARPSGFSVYGISEQEANGQVQSILSNPETNRALQVANQFTTRNLNQPYNLAFNIPPSSLAKQSGIGRTYELAVDYSGSYPKNKIFEGYMADPEYGPVIQSLGIKNYDDLLERSYKQLQKETVDQFRSLPVRMSFHQGDMNYLDSQEMLRDVIGHNHLTVFRGGDRHDFLNKVDPNTGLNSNEQFRAVHDYFGHAIRGNPFGAKGEEVAWASHQQMYSPLARIAMTAETRGQNSFVNYTPINAELISQMEGLRRLQRDARAAGDESTVKMLSEELGKRGEQWGYAKQASIVLPVEFTKADFSGGMPDYLLDVAAPKFGVEETLTHFGRSPDIAELDPSMYGTGIKGAELSRMAESTMPIRERSYAYRGQLGEVTPEPGLGPYVYQTKATGLYDPTQDPEKLALLSEVRNTGSFLTPYGGIVDQSQAATDLERLVSQYGYTGLLAPKAAILFRPTPVTRVR